ncbi:MAG TPA: transposase [Bacteroidales bacterium]|nr:transposase [Bacteroidales bacterium]
MQKFQNKYRIESSRLQNWDYGQNGDYYVTICTHGMETFFGKVISKEMILNSMGRIAFDCWQSIPDHFGFVILDTFIIMPNHIHGIITINKSAPYNENNIVPRSRNQGKNTLSSIIGSYKSAVTKSIRKTVFMFSWQPRFYDHVIHHSDSYLRIKKYIEDNPQNWEKDKYFNNRNNW